MYEGKQRLIERLSDYMNKDLTRGVLWSNPYQDYEYVYEYISESKKKGERSVMFYRNDSSVGDYRGGDIKIIGKLDLSALLRCIGEKIGIHIKGDVIYLTESFDVVNGELELEIYAEIPNKCPSQYTNEEIDNVNLILDKLPGKK